LELHPAVVVRQHASGAAYAYPLADPSLVCRADDVEQALATQRLFLAEHLGRIDAEHLARFVYPETTALHLVRVPLQRDDLQRRFGFEHPLPVACVAVPVGDALWVHVLALRHVVHVAAGESLEARVADEVVRQVAARELGPRELAALVGPRRHSLHRLDIEVKRPDVGDLSARGETRRARDAAGVRKAARALLEQIGTDMTHRGGPRRPALLARDAETTRLLALLGGEERVGVAVVGPALAGKTAVVDAVVERLTAASGRTIFATSGAALVAGQSGFGELAQRLGAVMRAAADLDAILYFDNLGDLFAGTSGGMEDLAAGIRPWVLDGRVRIVGECTSEAFEQFEKRQPALLACMHRVTIEPMSVEQTRAIVDDRARHARRTEPERPSLDPSAIVPLVELCERYLVGTELPGKAVRMLDELRAIHRHDVAADGGPRPIGAVEVFRAFSLRTGMPMFLLREDESLRRASLEQEFARRVIGQREAITAVTAALCTVKARLQPPGKPLANLLFVGPTGVGKTEVGKTLARILFGSPERMIRFDMSEYTDPYAAERLIRGTASDDGELTRKIRQQPFSVVLLDEIEKAHEAVFDLLLQVLGEGRLTDAKGRTTSFGNAIIIMTSNLGARHRPSGRGPTAGFGGSEAPVDDERRYYAEQVDRHFRPEFVNRIDRIIPFASLTRAEMSQVAEVSLRKIRERSAIVDRDIRLEVTPRALEALATGGYSPTYGARALRRHLEDALVAPVAGLVSSQGGAADGATVVVGVDETDVAATLAELAPDIRADALHTAGGLRMALLRRPRGRRSTTGVAWFGALRRNAAVAYHCPRIGELRSRVAYLTAELATAAGRDEATAPVHDAAASRELARLQQALSRIDDAMESLQAIEDLAIAAVTSDVDERDGLIDEATGAHAAFERALVEGLFEAEPRNGIVVVVDGHGAREGAARWLALLAAWADDRRWTITAHVEGDASSDWPPRLAWGPPRTLEAARTAVDTAKGRPPQVLLRVTGEHCGWLLALEHGLHRFWPADRASADHVTIRAITAQTQLGVLQLGLAQLAPVPFDANDPIHKRPALREVFADGTITAPGRSFSTTRDVDLAANGVLERLWFDELVRRATQGEDLGPELLG
jgi:ATP-dependent Clp protease ATP-binding subunit ClpC